MSNTPPSPPIDPTDRRARRPALAVARSPLALAVMSLLYERPMHPYEMQSTMRERGHHHVIKFKGGSIYDTVERLERSGRVATLETSREGRRPERTVYEITESGRDELRSWLAEMLSEPASEYPGYAAALAFILVLDQADAEKALRLRAFNLESRIAAEDAKVKAGLKGGLLRIFIIEAEYMLAMQKTELAWTRQMLKDLENGRLRWPTMEDFMALGYVPDEWHLKNRGQPDGGGAKAETNGT